jgi:putative membrane protein
MMGSGFGMGGFGMGLGLLFWIFVFLALYYVFVERNKNVKKETSASDILKKRYAAGEINREEYTRIRQDL